MAGYSSALWAIGVLFSDCITKDIPPPFNPPEHDFRLYPYQRLSAVLWSDAGRTREEIAELVGVSTRQVGQWFRIFRNRGLDELCTLHYRGDPGRLRPAQAQRLKQEIAKGVFHNAEQVRA